MLAITAVYEFLGETRREFGCCDTQFVVQASGVSAERAARAAEQRGRTLEAQLTAFDSASAVSRLNRNGSVTNEHVARIVRRGLEYYDRTDGTFDIRHGAVEQELKAFLRGDAETVPEIDDARLGQPSDDESVVSDTAVESEGSDTLDSEAVTVDGDQVRTPHRLDLNGLAKGYIVDRTAATLDGIGRHGFVSGGGDMTPPTGPVAIESPYGDEKPLRTLDTDWYVATSGGYRRTRNGTDHVYDPTTGDFGSRHESVTVVARRDCMEADALATTLAALPLADARSLADRWPGLEALIVHDGVFHTTDGFHSHVIDT
jgi:thiamine biosynthesis lipoprotein